MGCAIHCPRRQEDHNKPAVADFRLIRGLGKPGPFLLRDTANREKFRFLPSVLRHTINGRWTWENLHSSNGRAKRSE